MVTTLTDVNVLQESSQFSDLILSSDSFHKYIDAKKAVQGDEQAQSLLHSFQELKERYEEVQRFGKYHPDFHSVTAEVREFKRTLDTHPLIADYKKAEKELESLLTEVSQIIAYAVSPSVKVPTGNPFFDQDGCSGGCGSGGSCGCS